MGRWIGLAGNSHRWWLCLMKSGSSQCSQCRHRCRFLPPDAIISAIMIAIIHGRHGRMFREIAESKHSHGQQCCHECWMKWLSPLHLFLQSRSHHPEMARRLHRGIEIRVRHQVSSSHSVDKVEESQASTGRNTGQLTGQS